MERKTESTMLSHGKEFLRIINEYGTEACFGEIQDKHELYEISKCYSEILYKIGLTMPYLNNVLKYDGYIKNK
jgi:hypothetical protein